MSLRQLVFGQRIILLVRCKESILPVYIQVHLHLLVCTLYSRAHVCFHQVFHNVKAEILQFKYKDLILQPNLPWSSQLDSEDVMSGFPVQIWVQKGVQQVNSYELFTHNFKESLMITNPGKGVSTFNIGKKADENKRFYQLYQSGQDTKVLQNYVEDDYGQIAIRVVVKGRKGFSQLIFSLQQNTDFMRYKLKRRQGLTVKDLRQRMLNQKREIYLQGVKLPTETDLYQLYKELQFPDGWWHFRIE